MNFRKNAEELKNTPEFIKVAYDKYGNPIGVRPVNGDEIPAKEIEKPFAKMSVQTLHYDTKIIGQWLGVINQNLQTLREEIDLLESPTAKLIPILEDAISKNMEITNKQIDLVNKELQNYKILNNSILEQLNLVNENFSLLRKEISDNNYISRQLIAEFDTVKNEVRNSSTPSIEIINMLSSLNENFEILRSRVMEINRETIGMNDKINEKLDNAATKDDVSHLNAKFFDLATKEDLDMVISGFISKQEFHEARSELVDLINRTAMNKDELVSELMEKLKTIKRSKRKSRTQKIVKKKMAKKIRKKKIKMISKVIIKKMLLRKFGLTGTERVLVVTDKKMERIGNKVYEACRSINENTVFMVMANMKKTDEEPEDSVSEAMKNTDAIIGVTYHTLKKTGALRNAIELGARAFLMSKSLKFTLVK